MKSILRKKLLHIFLITPFPKKIISWQHAGFLRIFWQKQKKLRKMIFWIRNRQNINRILSLTGDRKIRLIFFCLWFSAQVKKSDRKRTGIFLSGKIFQEKNSFQGVSTVMFQTLIYLEKVWFCWCFSLPMRTLRKQNLTISVPMSIIILKNADSLCSILQIHMTGYLWHVHSAGQTVRHPLNVSEKYSINDRYFFRYRKEGYISLWMNIISQSSTEHLNMRYVLTE